MWRIGASIGAGFVNMALSKRKGMDASGDGNEESSFLLF